MVLGTTDSGSALREIMMVGSTYRRRMVADRAQKKGDRIASDQGALGYSPRQLFLQLDWKSFKFLVPLRRVALG